MSHEFGLQLLKNETVKQHKNDHSGTWGDLEQEFTEIFYFILMNFLNIPIQSVSGQNMHKTFYKTISNVLLKV